MAGTSDASTSPSLVEEDVEAHAADKAEDTEEAGSAWWTSSNSGACVVRGRCIQSRYYGNSHGYSNNERCYFYPQRTMKIRVVLFDTEANLDKLTINGQYYSAGRRDSGYHRWYNNGGT